MLTKHWDKLIHNIWSMSGQWFKNIYNFELFSRFEEGFNKKLPENYSASNHRVDKSNFWYHEKENFGRPNVAIFNLYNLYSVLYSMFNFLFNIQLFIQCSTFLSTFDYLFNVNLFIQHSIFYSKFNFVFNIQFFIQCSTFHSTFNYSFNVQLFLYSTFLSPHYFWSVTKDNLVSRMYSSFEKCHGGDGGWCRWLWCGY